MSLRNKLLKGGLQIAIGQMGQQALLFLRSVFIARLLPEKEFGIALTFMTVLSALDAITDVGIELFIVRAKSASDPKMQDTLHTLMIIRGILTALALFAVAYPAALLFRVPESTWAYQLLAIVPLLRMFMHLDFKRFERDYRFWPGTVILFVSFLAGTIAAIAAAYLWRNSVAIVIGAIVQVTIQAIASHIVAERKYGFAYVKDYSRELFVFGAPLILNGILLFSLAQGDRIVIASLLGLQQLEHYGVIVILTSGMTIVAVRVLGALTLPLLSEHAHDTAIFIRRYEASAVMIGFCSAALIVGFAFLGKPVISMAFGPRFDPSGFLVTLVAVQFGIKIMRSLPQRAFLASANTIALFVSNLVAATGLIAGAVAAYLGYGVEAVALCLAAAEFVAALHSIYGVKYSREMSVIGAKFISAIMLLSVALLFMHYSGNAPAGLTWNLVAAVSCGTAITAWMVWVSPAFKSVAQDIIRKRKLGR